MLRPIIKLLLFISCIYFGTCLLLYLNQEKIIFFPDKLAKEHVFQFNNPFEEKLISVDEKTMLHGLLFKSDRSKGLIFYLHGNAGCLDSWGNIAAIYTAMHYDVFMLDYRGYGKSEGKINSEEEFFHDIQIVYDSLKLCYAEDKITVLGYSIGTGPAAWIAAHNHPRRLILQAPYYNLTDMMKRGYPFLPTFILKYKFSTNEYLKRCQMPITLFHGDQDRVIYYGSSVKLKKEIKPGDQLITLRGAGHNGMSDCPDYLAALQQLLK